MVSMYSYVSLLDCDWLGICDFEAIKLVKIYGYTGESMIHCYSDNEFTPTSYGVISSCVI